MGPLLYATHIGIAVGSRRRPVCWNYSNFQDQLAPVRNASTSSSSPARKRAFPGGLKNIAEAMGPDFGFGPSTESPAFKRA